MSEITTKINFLEILILNFAKSKINIANSKFIEESGYDSLKSYNKKYLKFSHWDLNGDIIYLIYKPINSNEKVNKIILEYEISEFYIDYKIKETPREFILNYLKNIIKTINDDKLSFGYSYNSNTNTRIIKVTPLEFFENNKKYMEIESDFESLFNKYFPYDNIMFISTNSLIDINPEVIINKHNI